MHGEDALLDIALELILVEILDGIPRAEEEHARAHFLSLPVLADALLRDCSPRRQACPHAGHQHRAARILWQHDRALPHGAHDRGARALAS